MGISQWAITDDLLFSLVHDVQECALVSRYLKKPLYTVRKSRVTQSGCMLRLNADITIHDRCSNVNYAAYTSSMWTVQEWFLKNNIIATRFEFCADNGRYTCSSWEPHLRAKDVTCHTGSHSVTCHPTQVNAPHLEPQPYRLVLDLVD